MPINDEQAKSIKEQILKQVEQLPEEKREQIKQYILSMNNEELEAFLKKNAEMQQGREDPTSGQDEESPESGEPKCIMCLIAGKKIESLIIYEDEDYLAALEINPFSRGHTILIPKKHLAESKLLPSKALTLAKKIGNHLIKKLEAENFEINTSDELKHAIINIIPVYKGEKINYQRKPAKKEELKELKEKIGQMIKKPRVKREKKRAEDKEKSKSEDKNQEKKLLKYNRRIP